MIRRPPRSTRTDTLFPYTTLFRSRECDRLGVEIAARDNAAVAEHERIVGDRVRLDAQRLAGAAEKVEAGTEHLRLAAQAVWVLHAFVAVRVALADVGFLEQRSEERRVGKEGVSTGRTRWWPYHTKKKKKKKK